MSIHHRPLEKIIHLQSTNKFLFHLFQLDTLTSFTRNTRKDIQYSSKRLLAFNKIAFHWKSSHYKFTLESISQGSHFLFFLKKRRKRNLLAQSTSKFIKSNNLFNWFALNLTVKWPSYRRLWKGFSSDSCELSRELGGLNSIWIPSIKEIKARKSLVSSSLHSPRNFPFVFQLEVLFSLPGDKRRIHN